MAVTVLRHFWWSPADLFETLDVISRPFKPGLPSILQGMKSTSQPKLKFSFEMVLCSNR